MKEKCQSKKLKREVRRAVRILRSNCKIEIPLEAEYLFCACCVQMFHEIGCIPTGFIVEAGKLIETEPNQLRPFHFKGIAGGENVH